MRYATAIGWGTASAESTRGRTKTGGGAAQPPANDDNTGTAYVIMRRTSKRPAVSQILMGEPSKRQNIISRPGARVLRWGGGQGEEITGR